MNQRAKDLLTSSLVTLYEAHASLMVEFNSLAGSGENEETDKLKAQLFKIEAALSFLNAEPEQKLKQYPTIPE